MMALRLPSLSFEAPPPTLFLSRCNSSFPLVFRSLSLSRRRPPLHLRIHRCTVAASGREDVAEINAAAESASPEDLEYISQIKRVLELLKKNRDMAFEEVKLTIMIEDPRDAERKRFLGIEDDEVTRDDLVTALEDVNEAKIPQNRVALRLLAEEMLQWPNLEVETQKKKKSSSSYAKVTDTGIDPRVAAKQLDIVWDAAAEVESDEESSTPEVPPVVGYGALYLVTALPVLIGISVVLILFYNSLQ